jgi:hypothetical protein
MLRNGSSIRVARGLASTPAPRPTRLRFVGDLSSCTGFEEVGTKIAPVAAGVFHVAVQMDAGSTCAAQGAGPPLTSSMVVHFKGLRNGKLVAAETERTTVASVTMGADDDGHDVFNIVSTPIAKPTSALNGRTITLHITTDQDGTAIANACAIARTGLATLTFNSGPAALSMS